MLSAPIPENENDRLKAVMELGILDTKPEERFDSITKEAVEAFKVPISTITIMDAGREWYKSCQGLDVREAPREISFCAHAMLAKNLFIVEDTLKDDRFRDNPMVTGEPHIRFYAGVALRNKHGIIIGVFCIKDTKPRTMDANDIATMMNFAARAESELNK
jgi:GAF domain-containing protein